MKKIFVKTFFFGEHLRLCPWSLALASSIPVLGLESVCSRKGCPWPWPRIFFVSLALASSLVSSTPPLVDSSFSFLNLRKQYTNLKLKLLFMIETQKPLPLSKIAPQHFLRSTRFRSLRLNRDRPGSGRTLHTIVIDQVQIAHYTATQANHRYTNSAKLPTKLISKNHPLLEYWNIRMKNDPPIYAMAKAIEYPRTILDTSQ